MRDDDDDDTIPRRIIIIIRLTQNPFLSLFASQNSCTCALPPPLPPSQVVTRLLLDLRRLPRSPLFLEPSQSKKTCVNEHRAVDFVKLQRAAMALSGVYDGICGIIRSDCEASSSGCCKDGADGSQHKRQQHSPYKCWSSSHGTLLDPDLWSSLPVELIERVIRNLPMDAMLRSRSVCKAWKAYISSYGNTQICYKTPQTGPWCLAVIPEIEAIAVFDAAQNKWHHLPLPTLAAKHNMKPFSSDGGLVGFRTLDNSLFFVYNPLTRTCSALTPKQRSMGSENDKVWIVTDQSEGFLVVVVQESGRCEVYDSYSNQWNKSGMLPHYSNISQISSLQGRSVYSDGILYMISERPYDLITYDTITGSWSKLYVRWPEESWNHVLSEYRGRVYMLALQKENERLCFCEWELNSTGMLWTKVGIMPELFCFGVLGDAKKDWSVQILANRDLVLLRFVGKYLQEHLVFYSRISKHWREIPRLT